MLDFEQMIMRFGLAALLGAIMGWEREVIHKEAGIRTSMLVGAGAALFTMIGLTLPYMLGGGFGRIAGENGSMSIIANIVVGIGFLGAGLIVKGENHVQNLTTAAVVWFVASVGVLSGMGLFKMAIFTSISMTFLLYILRNLKLSADTPKKP
jgi:putative Mg2+ transporter-C (MgtC) family protein